MTPQALIYIYIEWFSTHRGFGKQQFQVSVPQKPSHSKNQNTNLRAMYYFLSLGFTISLSTTLPPNWASTLNASALCHSLFHKISGVHNIIPICEGSATLPSENFSQIVRNVKRRGEQMEEPQERVVPVSCLCLLSRHSASITHYLAGFFSYFL